MTDKTGPLSDKERATFEQLRERHNAIELEKFGRLAVAAQAFIVLMDETLAAIEDPDDKRVVRDWKTNFTRGSAVFAQRARRYKPATPTPEMAPLEEGDVVDPINGREV